jgi:hypothetical protein
MTVDVTTLKKVFKNTPERKRSIEKPKKIRLDDVENYLKMGGLNWRKQLRKVILKKAMVLHGPS